MPLTQFLTSKYPGDIVIDSILEILGGEHPRKDLWYSLK